MKKVGFYKGVIIALIFSLIILSFYVFQSLKSTSLKYTELEADYDKLKSDFMHSKNTVNSFQEKLESCELEKNIDREILVSEIEFYKNLSNDKDMLIELLYQDRVSDLMTNNPIDDFMRTHTLGAVNTSTLLNNDYLYLNLWKQELIHAYTIFNDMVHPYFDEYLDGSLSSIIDFANSEGELSVAFMNVEEYGRNSTETNESFDHRAIDRAIRAWEISEIYKEQTYKLRNYITKNGGEIEYLFDAEEFMIESAYEDIIIEREWAPVGVLKHAIKKLKIFDDILTITYLRGVDYTEVTEYINLK